MSTVLVVQSDLALSQEWCEAIEASGHSSITAHGVNDGIHRVREGGIDMVLLEHGHSDRSLADFVGELERLPDPPPFVLISGSPRGPEISAQLGAAAFLPKPCMPDEIVTIVNRYGAAPVRGAAHDQALPSALRMRLIIG